MLVKVTGKRDILTQPDVVKAPAAPADYVQQYSYQDIGSVKFLKADFNVAKVNALVGQSKFALLGPVRPQVAIWLVVDEGERRILPDQSGDGWSEALRAQTQAMGLPVSLPLMDLMTTWRSMPPMSGAALPIPCSRRASVTAPKWWCSAN